MHWWEQTAPEQTVVTWNPPHKCISTGGTWPFPWVPSPARQQYMALPISGEHKPASFVTGFRQDHFLPRLPVLHLCSSHCCTETLLITGCCQSVMGEVLGSARMRLLTCVMLPPCGKFISVHNAFQQLPCNTKPSPPWTLLFITKATKASQHPSHFYR